MVPLIKRSTDSLVAVIGEKATAEVTFEAIEYVCLKTATILLISYNNMFYYKVQLLILVSAYLNWNILPRAIS